MGLIEFVSERKVNFKMPSRKKIKSLSKSYADKKREDIKQALSKVDSIAITTDAWTSTKQRLGFLGVTVHYYKKFVLKSISLGVKKLTGSHTAENLANCLKSFFSDYDITGKIFSITGDNASNMRTAAESLKIKYHGCFAHLLNLIVTTAIKNLKIDSPDDIEDEDVFEFSKILSRCRKLVGLFSHSTNLNEQLLEEQPIFMVKDKVQNKLVLIQDVITRLNYVLLLVLTIFYFYLTHCIRF